MRVVRDPKESPHFGKAQAEVILDEIIGYREGEEALHSIRLHWVILLQKVALPLIFVVVPLIIALFRASGGVFLSMSGTPGQIDATFVFLVVSAVVVGIFWLWPKGDKAKNQNRFFMGLFFTLVATIAFRYMGGRLFDFNVAVAQTGSAIGDVFNILLYLMIVPSAVWLVWSYWDWQDDVLILTNQRVIKFHDRILGPHSQDQMEISDIQNVLGKTTSYPEHLLGYGTITVQSATLGRNIVYSGASNPWKMRDAISQRARARSAEVSASKWDRILDEKVFGKKPEAGDDAKPSRPPRTARQKRTILPKIQWLPTPERAPGRHDMLAPTVPTILRMIGIPENPLVEEQDGVVKEITWRRHWLFFILAETKPMLFLALAITAIVSLNWAGVLTGVVLIPVSILTLLIFFGWFAWEFEDYINDPYILNRNGVVDVEKKPFGPEDRRSASLGAIQNVSVQSSFISRLFGFGNVYLDTAGAGGQFTFEGVPRPTEVLATINNFLQDFKRQEEDRNINNSINLLVKYHQRQVYHGELNVQKAEQQS